MPFAWKLRVDSCKEFSLDEANSEIIKWVNKWQTTPEINGNYSLREYLGFTHKEYSNWVLGRWDAKTILKKRDWREKYIEDPIYHFFEHFDFLRWNTLKSSVKYWFQRRTRGWDDSETWSMDYSIAKLVALRLKTFKQKVLKSEAVPGFLFLQNEIESPSGELMNKRLKEWIEVIDKIILAFDLIIEKKGDYWGDDYKLDKRIEEGLALFRKHYFDLWW